MEILLVEDVAGVGDIGEMVKVKPGYARNYLIPKGFAVEAHAGGSKAIKHRMNQVIAKKKRLKDSALKAVEDWKGYAVTAYLRVGSSGRAFGSINTKDIAEALKTQKNVEVDRRRILLSEPLKKLGRHTVGIRLHSEVNGTFVVLVEGTQATEEEEKRAAEQARIQMEANLKKKTSKKADATSVNAEDSSDSSSE